MRRRNFVARLQQHLLKANSFDAKKGSSFGACQLWSYRLSRRVLKLFLPYIDEFTGYPQHPVGKFARGGSWLDAEVPSFSLLTIKFHGIPYCKMNGQLRGTKDPTEAVSYRHPLYLGMKRDPARSRAASPSPPRSERQPGTQRWDSRRIGQWQQLDPPFSFAPIPLWAL